MHFKQQIALKYAELVYYGLWFTPLREALDAFVSQHADRDHRQVSLSLYKGNVAITGRQVGVLALPAPTWPSFTMGESYDQKDAAGFIRILGLPARSRARARTRGREVCSGGRRSEDVGRAVPAAARSRIRALAAVVSLRPAPAPGRAGSQPRPCARAGRRRRAYRRPNWMRSLRGLEQIGAAGREPEFLQDEEAEDVHHFVEKQLVSAHRRDRTTSCTADAAATSRSPPTCACSCARSIDNLQRRAGRAAARR